MTVAIDDMDKTLLRKMQNEMHLSAAKCCQDVQRCFDRCSAPVIKAQKYVQHELEEFREDYSAMSGRCKNRNAAKFDRCAIQCVDKHVGLIPGMMETIKSVLSKESKGSMQI